MERARKRALANPNGYSHVWIVYDTDDFPAVDVNRVVEKCICCGKGIPKDARYLSEPYFSEE